MIAVARPAGQLGNRLFQFAHFVAFAADTGVTVANPAFGEYADHFPAFAGDALCRYPRPRRPLPRVLRPAAARLAHAGLRVAPLLPRVHAIEVPDTIEREVGDLDLPRGLVLVAGWQLRAYASFARQRDEIRRVFTPDTSDVAAGEDAVRAARSDAGVVVGVHRRRRDYAQWNGGRYFYSDEQYAAVMRSVAGELGGRVAFLVCSDEPVETGAFGDLHVHLGPGKPIEDLHALSLCDRLVGPPSTYSAWASFMGSVPRYEIADPAAAISASEFRASLDG